MEIKDAIIKADGKLETHKQLINKIINEVEIAEVYLQSKNVFHRIDMITELMEEGEHIILKWDKSTAQKQNVWRILYALEDDYGEVIEQRPLLDCPLVTRIKMHPFLGDFIIHVSNQAKVK